MTAPRNVNNGMWVYNFDNREGNYINSVPRMNNVYELTKASELVKFLHAAAGFPVIDTWVKAIHNNQFATWPGLTTSLIYKNLPKSDETIKGHLKQQRQNVRSTQNYLTDYVPPTITEKTHNIFAATIDCRSEIFTDATGPFPVISSLGNKYVLVLYEYDSNYIMVQPIKDRKKATTITAYKKQLNILKRCGLKPKLQKLDNEASQDLLEYINDENINYQLVPPHMHRRNLAERAIQTFKSHFIAMLCGCDPAFPLHLWCRLLPQAEITLNLLRTSRINPNLSAYAQLHGQFDYNRTPIAPPGTRVIVHENAAQRGTYGPHGTDGWYLGPAMDHYRCYRCYVTATGGERTSETVEFFPHKAAIPNLSSREVIHSSALDLIEAIKRPHPATPLQVGNQQIRALEQLAEIFKETSAVSGEIVAPPRVTRIKTIERQATKPATLPRVDAPPNTYHKQAKIDTRPIAEPRLPRLPPLPKNLHKLVPNARPQSCANHVAMINDISESWGKECMWQDMQETAILPKIANNVLCEKTGKPLTYRGLMKTNKKPIWKRALANEFGRLMQGVGARITTGTETLFPIEFKDLPKGRTAAYAKIVVDIRPQKKETHRARLVVGGDRVDYPYEKSTRTVDLDTTKMFFNSVISTPGARFMTMDIKDFYLGTPLKRYEYIRMQYDIIPQEIVEQYHLQAFKQGEYVYFEVRRGMYGLPQAGKIAYDQLVEHLKPHKYAPVKHTPGLWRHEHRDIAFILWVDDFGVKYRNRDDVLHLQNALQKLYRFEADWSGKQYIKIKLDWDYENGQVTLSLPDYIALVIERFRKRQHFKIQDSPHPYAAPKYGRTQQYAPNIPSESEISTEDNKFLEQVLGALLYYAMAIDCTMLVAINSVAVNKKYGMRATMDAVVQLLDYAATHPDAEVTFHKSNMILKIHSDASYLSEYGARSRVGGYFFLGNDKADHTDVNGPIAIECSLLKNIVSSAAEAELGGVFTNATRACGMRTALTEMGHPQPATPICTDNTTANDLVADRIKQRRSRAFDMRYFWIRDRVKQGQFHLYWRPGVLNLADYFTKHHPTTHHRKMRNIYLTPHVAKLAQAMNWLFCAQQPRGCINP